MSASFSDEVLVQPCLDISLLIESSEPEILPRATTMATQIDLRQYGAILEIYREALSPTSISVGTLPGCEEKKVAIKKIYKADLKTDFQKRQAAQEFPLHCSFKHEKIVKGLEWTENATEFILVMEYMDNPCYFQEKIDQNRRPIKSEAKIKSYIRDVLEGLVYLHSKGIVHGDIKLENMLIKAKEDGGIPTAKLCDFGLSRFLDKSTKKFHMETPVGTLCYMAPEIKANSYVDEKIDIWALGIILYKMAVAYRPTQVAGYKYGSGPIPFRNCDWKKRSPELQDLIQKLLETDPAKRISAADALEHPWFQV